MKKILVTNVKGGVGKSQLTLNIASCLAESNNVCIVDSDPQGTLISFREFIQIPIVSLEESDKYSVALIDTAPYFSKQLPDLMRKSDYILIPVRPNHADIVATKTIIENIPNGKKCGIVLTQTQHRVNLSEQMEMLQAYDVPILKQQMTNRVSYARSLVNGSVFQSTDTKAQNEILSITLEIFASL